MNSSKTLLFVALGVAFWFVAAMMVKFFGSSVFTENNPMLYLFFALSIPITFVFLFVMQMTSKIPYSEMVKPVAIVTYTAAFMDGIAMISVRKILYSESFEVAFHGAAWILWGVSMGLLIAYIMERRAAK